MKKVPGGVALLLFISSLALAQVKSPDQFLGYKLGTRYTPHYNIVNYCKQVAEAAPGMVKLEQYGATNEGRPLLLLMVTSPTNMARLEAIRLNNLHLAGMTDDKTAPDEKGPAIVWLSYNVHGNETSSSEAAMLTLYELVNPSNTKTKDWLQNTVVIIDPCINPDGRDRYVNWFNSVVGIQPNPQPFTREHSEPWPGGRPNHYYFDLNRDWAWQTQVETQQRVEQYNRWLPQVHVDYHEQYYNNPYYFAPAAEPYHEVITTWQREFQTIIGRNNAKYFDQNGWLFFTKERFDLFYPSYGDTYPLYKGAIGMTYEQGGHSRGGAAVINHDGDTLTLWDRLYHHFTTGMSTIEATAQNATKLVQEFKKYYDKARTAPPGEFKAYVIKADEGKKISRLKQLLDRNAIKWFDAEETSYTGINYFTGKAETIKANDHDVVINANQPNANLLKVLFERNSRLSDSVTYDITAWSVPFVYGLTTYGISNYVKSGLNTKAKSLSGITTQSAPVAWIVRWNGLNSVQFLSAILQKKVKVRYAEQPFKANGNDFDKGTLIITRTSNQSLGTSLAGIISDAARGAEIDFTEVSSSFVDKGFDFGSEKVHVMKAPKVGLLAGDGVSSLGMGEVWHFFDKQIGYPLNVIWANDLSKNSLRELDVLILPDGNYKFLADRLMNDALKDWVTNGGRLIALESAVAQLAVSDWGIKIKKSDDDKDKPDDKKEDYGLLRRYENRERDFIPGANPGSIFKVELDNSHPLAFGYDDAYYTLKQDNTIYDFFKDMGWNVGVIKKDNQVAGFVGSKLKDKLKDGLLFGVQDMGQGSVVYLADDPLFRSFWENGKLLFSNAVFMVGQ
ncbi:zinc carboxypeptidase [Niastella vici]|uniref:Zinc carboxypeptidase n=1 Tax=Niastella vici TaxID=1703345 RepID=A0A1V9FVL3_9BACT|nr:M14 metallopeptidase family protein [Niastella vici]OQP62357.1 zinc carboxypeptidase [Niastella vici]